MAVTGDGRAVTASEDEAAIVWDLGRGTRLHTLTGHHSPVHAVAVTGDGRAVTAGGDGTAIVWDLDTGRQCAAWRGDTGMTAATWGRPRHTLVAGDWAGGVHLLRMYQ